MMIQTGGHVIDLKINQGCREFYTLADTRLCQFPYPAKIAIVSGYRKVLEVWLIQNLQRDLPKLIAIHGENNKYYYRRLAFSEKLITKKREFKNWPFNDNCPIL